MFNLIPNVLGSHFQMNFTSESKLQIWVILRLINTVHFLHKSHSNQKEFDAPSHHVMICETSLWMYLCIMNNANPIQTPK